MAYQLGDNVLRALIKQESGGNPNAVSNKGARGITQIMPATAANPGYGVKPLQSNDPQEQIRFTRDYMGALLKTNKGDLNKALAAYNAGQGNVDKYGGVPPFKETQNYVKNIMRMANPMGTAEASEIPKGKLSYAEWKAQKAQPTIAQPVTQPTGKLSYADWKAQKAQPIQPQKNLTWGEIPGQALKNTPKSALNFAKGAAETVLHPIDTTQGLLNAAQGGVQNILPDSINKTLESVIPGYDLKNKETASKIGEFYKGRYGSIDGFKQALASDPVGVAADISTVLGGAGALTKSSALTKAARLTNPITPVVEGTKALSNTVGAIASPVIGLSTGAGTSALKAASKAGQTGGQVANDFVENMRGKVPLDTVLDDSRNALGNMRSSRGANYREGMTGVQADTKILPFSNIENAVNDAFNVGVSRGGHVMNQSASGAQEKIAKLVDTWKKGDPTIDHTAAGLDELKRSIGDVRDSSAFGTPERAVADKVYHAVKNEIVRQVPEYKGVMAEYEKQSTLIKEIERALSLGDKASADTSIRKLQSLTRNNVNTNFGNRTELAKKLEDFGAENLLTKVSGQALSSPTPRGLQALAASGFGGAALALQNPAIAGTLLMQSPRLMGEAAYGLGKVKGVAGKAINNKLSQAMIKSAPALATANKLSKDKK